jgi:hypothetical protein
MADFENKLLILMGGKGKFRQVRVNESLNAGTTTNYNFDVPRGKTMFLTHVKYGNITPDKISIRIEGYNSEPLDTTIGQPLINFSFNIKPWIGLTNNSGGLVLKNTDTAAQTFDAVFDAIILNEEDAKLLRE